MLGGGFTMPVGGGMVGSIVRCAKATFGTARKVVSESKKNKEKINSILDFIQ